MIKVFFRRYKLFLAVCVGYAIFSVVTSLITGINLYAFLVWNLFLALLPLGLSFILVERKKPKKLTTVLLFIAWLLLIPNSFYLITDLIHLSQFTFYIHTTPDFMNAIYIYNLNIWIGLINILTGVILGCIAGLQSLRYIHKYLATNFRRWLLFAMIDIFILIGFGIWIGRFLRFNSWDVIDPMRLGQSIIDRLDLFTLGFTILFASTVAIMYALYYKYQRYHERQYSKSPRSKT